MELPDSLQPLMQAWEDSFVAFADVLGFAEQVLTLPRFLESDFAKSHAGQGVAVDVYSNLLRVFNVFHSAVSEACNHSSARGVSALVFSDSVYFKSQNLSDLSEVCVRTVRHCLRSFVPLRIGVGFGSFVAYRFSTDTSPERTLHSSQFLGSAVVNAYRAESGGSKGIRVIGGRSIEQGLTEPNLRRMWLPLTSASENAAFELNYLYLANEFAVSRANSTESRMNNGLWRTLKALAAAAPAKERRHYDDTKAALQRMNEALQYPALADYPSD